MTAPAPGNAVQTLGPADPNAPFMQKIYTVLTALSGLASLASTFGLITTGQETAVSNAGTSIVGAIAAVGLAVASFRTRKQINNGTFDAAPPTPPPAPERTAIEALQTIGQQVNDQITSSVAQVHDGIASVQAAAGAIGVLGAQVIPGPLGDLLRSVTNEQRS